MLFLAFTLHGNQAREDANVYIRTLNPATTCAAFATIHPIVCLYLSKKKPDMAADRADELLLQQFRDPSTREAGYTAIVKKYQERLYWHIRRMVVDHDDANDVLQNVFLRVWKALDNFREDAQLFTWLYRIATNESLTLLEQKKRKAAVPLGAVEDRLSNSMRADQHFDPARLEWKLQLAIQQLPEKQRAVFSLRYFDEMPYAEMSRVFDTSEGALKASYHHAVKKIEDFMLNH